VSGRDIRVRLDRYVSDVLALPEAEQLADLTVFQMAIEVGRQMNGQTWASCPVRAPPAGPWPGTWPSCGR